MYKSSDEEKRNHSSWEHANGSFIHEAMEEEEIDGRHVEVRNTFSFLDDTFSMSTPQRKRETSTCNRSKTLLVLENHG